MIALPHPTTAARTIGQPDSADSARTAGQPDDPRTLRYTAGDVPVVCMDDNPGAPIYLVTISLEGEHRRAYVIGAHRYASEITRAFGGRGYTTQAQLVERIDHSLPVAECD